MQLCLPVAPNLGMFNVVLDKQIMHGVISPHFHFVIHMANDALACWLKTLPCFSPSSPYAHRISQPQYLLSAQGMAETFNPQGNNFHHLSICDDCSRVKVYSWYLKNILACVMSSTQYVTTSSCGTRFKGIPYLVNQTAHGARADGQWVPVGALKSFGNSCREHRHPAPARPQV